MAGLFDLSGTVALVTGGNSGVGYGLAEGLVLGGATVQIWGTNPEKTEAALDQLRAHGGAVSAQRVDVSDEGAVIEAVGRLRADLGRLDACFANAGISGNFAGASFLDSTLEDVRRLHRVNIEGTYATLREAAKVMVDQGEGGSLVATASLAGARFGAPHDEAYASTKAGIVGITRSLAVALGKHGIRSNAILPGWTMSPQFEPWAANPKVADKILARIPLRRFGQPADWHGLAVYLASSASSFHSGDVFTIDGAFSVM